MTRTVFLMLLLIGFTGSDAVSNPQEIQSYINQLNDKDVAVSQNAYVHLITIGKPAERALALALAGAEKRLRMKIVKLLQEIGPSPASIPALIKELRQPDFLVERHPSWSSYHGEVSSALSRIGPPAIPALTEALSDGDKPVRNGARDALWYVFYDRQFADLAMRDTGDKAHEAAPALIRLLNDEDDQIRAIAATVLGLIGQSAQDAAPVLIRMVRADESDAVRAAAAGALGTIGDHSEATVDALIATLKDKHIAPRSNAAEALGRIGRPAKEAVPILIKMFDIGPSLPALGYQSYRFQQSIVSGLAGIGTPQAIQKVIATALNKDEAVRVRRTAATRLGRIGFSRSQNGEPVEEIVLVLFHLLEDKELLYFYPKCAAMLGQIGKPAIPTLIEGLSHESVTVRKWSASAFATIGPAAHEAVDALVHAFTDENEQVKINAARALKAIGTPVALKAIEGFTEPHPQKIRVRRD